MKLHNISAFYLDKQKSFVPKKKCSIIFYKQNFFVCQDRKLKFSGSLWFKICETSQNFSFLSWPLRVVLSFPKCGFHSKNWRCWRFHFGVFLEEKAIFSSFFFGENFPLWEKGGKKVGQELLCQVIKAPFLKSPTPSPLLYCGHKAKAHFLDNKLNYWVV